MSYDFNGADRQSSGFDPIPAGSIVPVTMGVRRGGAGEGGCVKDWQASDAGMRVGESGPVAPAMEAGSSNRSRPTR